MVCLILRSMLVLRLMRISIIRHDRHGFVRWYYSRVPQQYREHEACEVGQSCVLMRWFALRAAVSLCHGEPCLLIFENHVAFYRRLHAHPLQQQRWLAQLRTHLCITK